MATIQVSQKQLLRIHRRIADEIDAGLDQVHAAVELLDSGATVPFISRYRKELTGGLTDVQLRTLEERLGYLRDMEERRTSVISLIDELGKLDEALHNKLLQAGTKSELEDLYLPFKRRRKTKGRAAIEAGLEPLADCLWFEPSNDPVQKAVGFVNAAKGIADTKAALDGAKYILMERFAENADLISRLRTLLTNRGYLCAQVITGKEAEGEKFQDYFDFQEKLEKIPSHRALAMFRGRNEGVLSLNIKLREPSGSFSDSECIAALAAYVGLQPTDKPADSWRAQVVSAAWKIKLSSHLQTDLFVALRGKSDAEAIQVFASNLKDLLLSAPAGERCTMGLDPGYRSGVKVVVINQNGMVLDHVNVYPHAPQKQWSQSLSILSALCKKHTVELIAIGNGTASRETDRLAGELIKTNPSARMTKVVVSESGASVYSASLLAEREFPDLDVTVRGAISIARRLQDPLAELVKIDPKAIGVGQYQHDLPQSALARSLDATVEDCVNSVGVDLNTASAALLSRVAGLGETIAVNIVHYRDDNGPFRERRQLKKVPRLGSKAFEQSAGFLRIVNGKNPLDASGVHPEAYPLVKKILARSGQKLEKLIGDTASLNSLNAEQFVDTQFGLPTVQDIISELDKPGRDPRPEFQAVQFSDGIDDIKHLTLNKILEGQITNVTNFGAFVDIGVHQDGLVHISAISHKFVKNPHEVLKAGDIVKVKVMSVDVLRKRIGLSMRLEDDASEINPSLQHRSARPTQNGARPAKSLRRNTQRTHSAQQSTGGGSGSPSALALSLKQAFEKDE